MCSCEKSWLLRIPLTSFTDDVAALKKVLLRKKGPVVARDSPNHKSVLKTRDTPTLTNASPPTRNWGYNLPVFARFPHHVSVASTVSIELFGVFLRIFSAFLR